MNSIRLDMIDSIVEAVRKKDAFPLVISSPIRRAEAEILGTDSLQAGPVETAQTS